MAPNSRIFLTRHAQAEHNVDLDYQIPDAPLTALGRKQAIALAPKIPQLQEEAQVVVSSPLQRTLQTTLLAWAPAVRRLGKSNIVCLPEAQECNDFPCDTGSSREFLEQVDEFNGLDFSALPEDWTSKKGFWAADAQSLANRAKVVRQSLRERPEENIVLVAHGDVLRRITCDRNGPSTYMWKNAEVRIFKFDPDTVETDDCFLKLDAVVPGAGGYGFSDAEIVEEHYIEANGKL